VALLGIYHSTGRPYSDTPRPTAHHKVQGYVQRRTESHSDRPRPTAHHKVQGYVQRRTESHYTEPKGFLRWWTLFLSLMLHTQPLMHALFPAWTKTAIFAYVPAIVLVLISPKYFRVYLESEQWSNWYYRFGDDLVRNSLFLVTLCVETCLRFIFSLQKEFTKHRRTNSAFVQTDCVISIIVNVQKCY
jgi:hypothetical protein